MGLKPKYIECKFNKSRNKDLGVVRLGGQEYLGLIIHNDGEIEKYVNHRIRVGWMKWRSLRSTSRVLFDRKMFIKLRVILQPQTIL